jgi:hypothetical protein
MPVLSIERILDDFACSTHMPLIKQSPGALSRRIQQIRTGGLRGFLT